jgi:hypothetical protein
MFTEELMFTVKSVPLETKKRSPQDVVSALTQVGTNRTR